MNVILTSIECDGCNVIGDSTYGEGLSTGGPWNHPLIDSLVLSSVNTSATCQLEKNYVRTKTKLCLNTLYRKIFA
jgi:hypothetical protein